MTKEILRALMHSGTIALLPTQKSICFPIVSRIYKKMKVGVKTRSIQVHEGSIIVEGHHRYLASLIAEVMLDMVPCPLPSAKDVRQWNFVELVDEDWDNEFTVDKFDREDATFSGLSVSELRELIT
jgi:hypothetical protein